MAALTPTPELPPELAALAGGPPPGAPAAIQIPGGPPGLAEGPGGAPAPGPLNPAGGPDLSERELLEVLRAVALQYMDVASDEVEKAEMAKVLQIVQKLFATSQQNDQAAQGGIASPQALAGMRQALRP